MLDNKGYNGTTSESEYKYVQMDVGERFIIKVPCSDRTFIDVRTDGLKAVVCAKLRNEH